jgi:thioredoxin-related protein
MILAAMCSTLGIIALGGQTVSGQLPAVKSERETKPDAKSVKADVPWFRDLDQAKKLAKASGKDLLLLFTGTGWCQHCIELDQQVLHEPGFVEPAGKDFVFVELDFTFGGSLSDKAREAQLRKLEKQFLVTGMPTMVLADADGLPYRFITGYMSGSGVKTVMFLIRLGRAAKAVRDSLLNNAKQLTGDEHAEKLHNAISAVEPFLGSMEERGGDAVLTFYKEQVADILRSSSVGSSLRKRYESRIANAKEWHAREAVFARLNEFDTRKDFPKAIEYIASALETNQDKSMRWRLERARQVYLEWLGKYDEALINARRLQKLPDLSDKDRKYLVDRECFNLFNLERIDEGIALYDREIVAASGNLKERRRLLWWKAELMVTHRAPTDKGIQACLEYRQACALKSDEWWTASYLLAREYQAAGQYQQELKLLDELIATEKRPWCLLMASESHLALGQAEQAKAQIVHAKKAVAALARSEKKTDRDAAAHFEPRIAALEKRIIGVETKQ